MYARLVRFSFEQRLLTGFRSAPCSVPAGEISLAHRGVLFLARTIADMAGSARLQSPHVAEAIQYRQRLRQ